MAQLMNWTKFHVEALRFLFLKCFISGCTIPLETMLKNCYRTSERGQGRSAVEDLVRKAYIKMIEKTGDKAISLNKYLLPEIKKIIHNPITSFSDGPPLERMIPDDYENKPLFISEGERASKGIKGAYYYYPKKNDPYDIMYIIVSGSKQTRKFLGSLTDPQSPIARVYGVAKRMKKFIKADFNTAGLPHSIVENRQPIKAAIDMLEYYNLIRKTGKKRNKSDEYEVTDNNIPSSTLDDYDGGNE